MSNAQRRLQMLARARVIGRLMLFATAIGNLMGLILALAVFGYFPSAGIILFILLTMVFYIPIAVNRWFAVFDRNELAHQQLADDLLEGGRDPGETEIHVHTERMLIRAKLPITRFIIIWPMLSIVFPLAIFAAAIESWMYAASGVDSALNKLLLVLMASSIRSIFQAVNVLETLANLTARAIRPDALDRDEEEL
jgi:hypothetical protein